MLPSQGFDPLPTLRNPVLGATYHKIFIRAPSAPIYTNFERGARAEKTQFFFGQNFPQKVPKNAFFGLF